MKPNPRLHTSPLLRPEGVPAAPVAATNLSGGFKSVVPGVGNSRAPKATLTASDVAVRFPIDCFPRLIPSYNANQPQLGMFSLWELRIENDPAERVVASVMADSRDGEAWMGLFKSSPLLLENNQYAASVCQDSRRQLSTVVSELAQIPGMDDIIRVINEVEGKLLQTAATLETTVRIIPALEKGSH